MAATAGKGRILFLFLVVATLVALFCSMRFNQQTAVITAIPHGGWGTSTGLELEQDERYVTQHVTEASHDVVEERRNETARDSKKESGSNASLTGVDHSVGRTNAPEVLSLEMSSTEVPSPELVSPSTSPRSGLGYMLTFSYSDQLTGAVLNVLSLMCLATKFGGVRVVEPLVVNSDLGVNGSRNWTEQVKFGDIYDVNVFEKYASTKHFNQFVPYETFIRDAPRKVLLVQYYACGDQTAWNISRKFCDTNGFELIDKVCLTHSKGMPPFSIDSLKKQIYSKYKPSEVVVLFERFGGIDPASCAGQKWHLCGKYTTCERGRFNMVTEPSPTVFSDANSYIQKYLNGSSKYISVMVRLEQILLSARKFSAVDAPERARQCFANVLIRWRDIKHRTGITTTFLTMDVGRYGSKGYRRYPEKARAVHPAVVQFLSAIYGRETSLEEWEDTFTTVGLGQTKTSGYIAMMQKVIATKGTVLMLVGSKTGSSFLATSKNMFHRFSSKGQLIELNNDCS